MSIITFLCIAALWYALRVFCGLQVHVTFNVRYCVVGAIQYDDALYVMPLPGLILRLRFHR